jgi:Mitochondrial carrier protein
MRDMDLGLAAYLRFILSGAICCSGVHLAVTPIDVVKTKVQADPIKYPGKRTLSQMDRSKPCLAKEFNNVVLSLQALSSHSVGY